MGKLREVVRKSRPKGPSKYALKVARQSLELVTPATPSVRQVPPPAVAALAPVLGAPKFVTATLVHCAFGSGYGLLETDEGVDIFLSLTTLKRDHGPGEVRKGFVFGCIIEPSPKNSRPRVKKILSVAPASP